MAAQLGLAGRDLILKAHRGALNFSMSRQRRLCPSLEQLERRDLFNAGVLEQAFGDDGLVETTFTQQVGSPDKVVAAILSGDKIVVGGNSSNGHGDVVAVSRHSLDGTLDDGFGVNGKVTLPWLSNSAHLRDMVLDNEGRILLAGRGRRPASNFTLSRLLADGTPDPSFGANGLVTYDNGSAEAVFVTPTGAIVVAPSQVSGKLGVLRFTGNGSLDRDFGSLGLATAPLEGRPRDTDVISLADGSLVVAAKVRRDHGVDLVLAKFSPGGTLDPSFGSDGLQSLPITPASTAFDLRAKLTVGSDERITVALTHRSETFEHHFVVSRLNSDGSFDESFGNEGRREILFPGKGWTSIQDVVVREDGVTYVSGVVATMSGRHILVSRLLADGSFDSSFADGGVLEQPANVATFETEGGLVVTPDGGAVLAFSTQVTLDDDQDFTLMGITATGELNENLGSNGFAQTNLLESHSEMTTRAVATLRDGRILALQEYRVRHGRDIIYFGSLRRYHADGELDLTFGSTGEIETPVPPSQFYSKLRGQFLSIDDQLFVITADNKHVGIGRLTDTGEPDPTFGSGGWYSFAFYEWMLGPVSALPVSKDKFLVIGEAPFSEGDQLVGVMFTTAGLDIGFGDGGVIRIPITTRSSGGGVDLCRHEDGSFSALVGDLDYRFTVSLQRFFADGTVDASYGDDGRTFTGLTTGYGHFTSRHLICLPSGGVLVAGPVPGNDGHFRTLLSRYDDNGRPDLSFGTSSRVFVGSPLRTDISQGILVDELGRILVATDSTGAGTPDFALTRLNTDGTIDEQFGSKGTTTFDIHGFEDSVTSLALAANGDVIISGLTRTGIETRGTIVWVVGDRTDPSPWHNHNASLDVDANGLVTSFDVLTLINDLNHNGSRRLPPFHREGLPQSFLDVNDDSFVTSADALAVINGINRLSRVDDPEPEFSHAEFVDLALHEIQRSPQISRGHGGIRSTRKPSVLDFALVRYAVSDEWRDPIVTWLTHLLDDTFDV